MQNLKIKILLLVTVFLAIVGFVRTIDAADPSVFVSPATLSKNIGEKFNLSIRVNPTGEKVCVVEGKLNLDKLSCQSVTMGDGIMAQSSPSCNDLYFLLGIPGCTTNDKILFTMTVRAESAGTATVNFTEVDIIGIIGGESVSISSASLGGSYTLTALIPKEETISPKKEITSPIEEEEITPPVEEEITTPTDKKEITPPVEEEITTPTEEVIPEKELVTIPPIEKTPKRGLASLVAAIGTEISQSAWKMIIIIISLAILIFIGIREWQLFRQKKIKLN